MKKTTCIILSAILGLVYSSSIWGEHLVILHTNDTHSQIEPNEKGQGGILQRKAIIDSIREAEKNVLLIDAGDVVQGSLYFRFFRGDVEYNLMNKLGYDIQILGNHEFDNGLDELAAHYKTLNAKLLSANYDFTDTPLNGLFSPYVVKEIDGKKIGIFALNVNPENLISKHNTVGLKFKDIMQSANETAEYLKKKLKCNLVIVVTHIGYTSKLPDQCVDVDVASKSKYIDVIIGGHSHTAINPENENSPAWLINNANGKPVLVTQTGKYGVNLGYIDIDLDKIKGNFSSKDFEYKLIPVTDRFPKEKLDAEIIEYLKPYRAAVDSVNNRVIAYSEYDLDSDDQNGGYANWAGDYARRTGEYVLDSLRNLNPDSNLPQRIDMGFMNVGGIRKKMTKGAVTEGQMLSTFPFANRMVILKLKGKDIIEAMQVAANRGGEGVSENVRVVLSPCGKKVLHVVIDGEIMEPEKDYYVSTIDYIAEGNDSYVSMKNGERIWTDEYEMSVPILRYVEQFTKLGLPIAPDLNGRFVKTPFGNQCCEKD